MTEQMGYVTMRNQDGTHHLCYLNGENGFTSWSECRSERVLVSAAQFAAIEARQEESRQHDNPDRGFYGIYNLMFHPVQ